MSSVYAANRDLVDDGTDRAFFVRDGVHKQVLGGPDVGTPPRHPDHEDRGERELPVAGGVLLEPDDVPPNGKRVWLKGFGCVRHTRDAFEYTGEDIDVVRTEGVDVVHWVPAGQNVPLRLRTMSGDIEGHAEPGVADYDVDDLLQFERIGFARLDALSEGGQAVAYYAHP
jgi:glutamyl-tRNA synthetase